MSVKNTLAQKITSSALKEEDKELWNLFIKTAEEEAIEAVLEILKMDEAGALDFLTANLKAKIEAFRARDMEMMKGIINEEREYLEGLLKKSEESGQKGS